MDHFLKKVTFKFPKYITNIFVQECIVRKSYQGRRSLEVSIIFWSSTTYNFKFHKFTFKVLTFMAQGNQSKQFIVKVDSLEAELLKESSEAVINGMPFMKTVRAFRKVVDSSFGLELDPQYKETINEFKMSYLELEISIIPKVV